MTGSSPGSRLMSPFLQLRDGEARRVVLATLYGFAIFVAYYLVRPVRDEISSADRGNLQVLWTAVFFVMLLAVPAYSWVASRWHRGVFVPLANRFFALNLVLFWGAIEVLPEGARPWIDRVFYVWASVFALFVVTVYWGLLADTFTREEGARLFAFVSVGASIGGILGSSIATSLASCVGPFVLLLLACVPLEAAAWCARALHRAARGLPRHDPGSDLPLPGTALSGIRTVFRSRYLSTIALYILLMTFASTVLYFQQADLIGAAFSDRGERTAFFARIDLWVNVLTIAFQAAITMRMIRWIGLPWSLAMLPLVALLGFLAVGAWPLLAVLVALQVLYRTARYGIAKPTREILFTVVPREEKYKSKAFIDAAVYRGGDLVSAWIYAGLAALGLSVASIALAAAPLAAAWVGTGWWLGRSNERIRTDSAPETP